MWVVVSAHEAWQKSREKILVFKEGCFDECKKKQETSHFINSAGGGLKSRFSTLILIFSITIVDIANQEKEIEKIF